MELFPITGGAYATVPRPPTAVGGDGISHKRCWPMSRAERAAADNCAVRAARWPKGDVRANARISPASPASDFGQRPRICDVCQRYNMPEGRPLANMGVATNGSETAYSVLCVVLFCELFYQIILLIFYLIMQLRKIMFIILPLFFPSSTMDAPFCNWDALDFSESASIH